MKKIKYFEDILIWPKAKKLSYAFIKVTNTAHSSKDFSMGTQVIRAASSVIASIADGFIRKNKKEFFNFLSTNGSIAELRSHLHLALDQRYIDKLNLQGLYLKISEALKMVQGFIIHLKGLI